jgi:hypothetical protein
LIRHCALPIAVRAASSSLLKTRHLTHTESRTEPPTKQIKAIETKLNE